MRPYQEEKIFNLTQQQYSGNKIQSGSIFHNRYEIISDLGFGSYGKVFKAKDKEKVVAIKIINLKKIYQKRGTNVSHMKTILLREEQNMKKINQINSSHIVKYYQSMLNREGTLKAIIMQFCEGPTLSQYIQQLRKQKQQGLSEQQSLKYIYQIAEGLSDLYKLKIMHRDLHPGNIMFHEGKLIIIDFGLSKLVTMSQKIEQATVLGNPITVAPEIVDEEHKYGMKVDVWSLGVIFYFLLTAGKYPFIIKLQNADSQQIHEQMKTILHAQFDRQNKKSRLSKAQVSDNTRDFLQKLLCFHQQKRYNINQVLKDKIFENSGNNNLMIDEGQQQQKLYNNQGYLNTYMGE